MLQVQSPFQQFFGLSGDPLDDGSIYIGVAGQNPETNPIAVFWDEDGTLPAAQPLKTLNGYLVRSGTPARVYVNAADFSMTAKDRRGRVVFNVLNATAQADFVADIADKTDPLKGDNLVGFKQSNSAGAIISAVGKTVHDKLQEIVSAKDFGATGDGVTNDLAAITAAWEYCYPRGASLYFPTGTYLVSSENNFPFRQAVYPPVSLLDCNNMIIFGDGPSTILKTSTIAGGDVLQLNGLKNFHVRNLAIESVISGSDAGSNGISITGGYDNLTFDHVWCDNLAYVDKVTYVDGGKAFSIQTPVAGQTVTCGSLKATNIFANGCVYGFGFEFDSVAASAMPTSVDVDIVASNCRQAVIFSAGSGSGALPASMNNGVRVKVQSINCMQDVVLSRCHGVDVDCQIVTTKTQAQRLLSYTGQPWSTADGVADIIGAIITYAKNSRVAVYGSKGSCRHKAKIGGALDPSSGLGAQTSHCDIYLNIVGTSDGVDIAEQDAGGNVIADSTIYATTTTALTYPASFYAQRTNILTIGYDTRFRNITLAGTLGFAGANGKDAYHNIFLQSDVLSVKQTFGSSADIVIEQWLNHSGTRQFGIRNDGAFATAGRATASNVATIKGALPIYTEDNVFYGWVPVYTTYTP